jgi:triphosphatase
MKPSRAPSGTVPGASPAPASGPRKEPVEIELKLTVPETARVAVRGWLNAHGTAPPVKVTSVYFDTADHRLASQRAALRIRRIGDASPARWVQTLKTEDDPGALTRRGEWETPVSGPRPDLSALTDSPLRELLDDRAQPLVRIFRTSFDRTVRAVRFRGALIEVALDEGQIAAGRRKEPILEIELELREGSPSAIFALALDLIGRGRPALALLPGIDSKAARGYRLAQRIGHRPVPAAPESFAALLEPHIGSLEAARRIVGHGVLRVLANVRGAVAGDDLEYVHQARVALRRTRSALRLLAVAIAADDPVARDLRWMADCFGAVRDWDVLLTQTLPSLRGAMKSGDDAQWARLLARAQVRRQRQQRRLRATLASARFVRAALRLLQWADEPASGTPTPLVLLAPRAVERGHDRLIGAGRNLPSRSAQGRHRLRILAKRQRYALEMLTLMMPGVPGRTLKLLSRLQQTLGEINDVHVAASILPSLTRSRALVRGAERWSARSLKRKLPKAAALLARLQRRGSGL